MKPEDKMKKENEHDLVFLEALRTGEEHGLSQDALKSDIGKEAFNDLVSIAEAFKGYRPAPDDIPEAVDQAILSDIRSRADEIQRQRKVVFLFPRRTWAAAVGVLALFIISWNLFLQSEDPTPPPMTARLETLDSSRDVDGSGSVDIIDAYMMARRVKEGGGLSMEWDFDHSGTIDKKDIQSLAMTAVALNSGDV